MSWSDTVDAVAERAGVSRADARRVLGAFVEVLHEALGRDETVAVPKLGTFSGRWSGERTVRAIHDGRKHLVDGGFRPTFRAAARLRGALRERTPQIFRDPEQQRAWRLAETLVGDLALYHSQRAPHDLPPDSPPEVVRAACSAAFGPAWARVCASYETQIPEGVRAHRDHLASSALRRWSTGA